MKRIICLLLLLVIIISLAACGGGKDDSVTDTASADNTNITTDEEPATDDGTTAEAGEPQYGGTLNIQYINFNTVFDPAMGPQYVYSLWLEYLFAPDWSIDDPEVYGFKEDVFTLETATGQIAESWEWDADTMQFTVTIRDDIYFQEKDAEYDVFGARNLTAEDVKYSYDRVTGLGSGFDETNYVVVDSDWRDSLTMLESIEVVDNYTRVFQMNSASETKLSEFAICQVNITGTEWDILTENQQNDWHYACGTGPYILTEYVADNHFTFVKNENYYAYDERNPDNKLPYLDGITLQKYNDSTSLISGFISGDLDYIIATAGLATSEKEQIKNAVDDLDIQTFVGAAQAIGLKVNNELFSDINVRKAMQMAINLEEVSTAFYGLDELQLPGMWSSNLEGFSSVEDWDDDLISQYEYNPEAAKTLLEEAGYPDGFEFTVSIDIDANVEVFQLAKSYLSEVGINMNIETLTDMMAGREIQGNRDDQRVFNFGMGNSVDPGFAFQSFATTGFGYATYADDTDFDEMLTAVRDALTLEEQQQAAKEAEIYFAQQHWYIALSGLTENEAFVSSDLGGLQNGELLNAGHLMKAITARIWNTTAAS